MTVAGIDYSTRAVDIVVIDEDTGHPDWTTIRLHGDTPLERARSLRGRLPLRTWWDDRGVYLAGIEDPIGQHAHTSKALGFVGGSIAVLLPAGLTLIQTPTNEWKRLLCGNAKASKPDVRDAVASILGADTISGWTQDACDAYAIGIAVYQINDAALARQKGAA